MATSAELSYPRGLAVDTDGNIFVADQSNNRIRKIDRSGIITTVAGSGQRPVPFGPKDGSDDGDDGPATSARLLDPTDVCFDASGCLLIADAGHYRIRKIGKDGRIATIVGQKPSPIFFYLRYWAFKHYGGDGGSARGAQLQSPTNMAIDAAGNLFISDAGNERVRRVDGNGLIATLAGNGSCGSSGDGGRAFDAKICSPAGLAITPSGDLLIADMTNNRIRIVSMAK